MRALIPCTDCLRHVRSDEESCPFCGAAVDASTRRPEPSTQGLSRAAILALGAAMVACSTPQANPTGPGPSVTTPDGKTTPPAPPQDPGEMRTLYGMAPPPPSAAPPPSAKPPTTGPKDMGGPAGAYGAPPPPQKP